MKYREYFKNARVIFIVIVLYNIGVKIYSFLFIYLKFRQYAGHCWRSRDELISDVLLRTPTYGRKKAGRPARTYIQQLCEDTGCSPEDLPEAMNDREKWRERVRDIRATSTTWWWWWWWCYSYSYAQSAGSVSHSEMYVTIPEKKKLRCLKFETKMNLVVSFCSCE